VFVDKSVVFAKEVNQFLAACGYPLCRGGIMAGSAGGTAKLLDWRQRFSRWIEQGSPNDLLNASIYFDLRCIVGSASLAQELRRDLLARTQKTPRFLKQMAINALQHSAPVNWFGLVDTDAQGCIDLKLQGTLAFVNAARIYALAYGIEATNTSERIEEFGRIKGLSSNEFKGWIGGFEYLQLLRLRNQLESSSSTLALRQPNRIRLTDLNDLDRRVIRESLKIAQSLQERLQLDYDR
jgi:CBS domain-containing protein